MLIEELRKLGNETVVGWAEEVDCQLGNELEKEDPSVKMREKNSIMVDSLWFGQGFRSTLAQSELQLYSPFDKEDWSAFTLLLDALAAIDLKFWF